MAIDFKEELDFQPETSEPFTPDFDDETKAKINDSLFYSTVSGGDPNDVYDITPNLNKQIFGTEKSQLPAKPSRWEDIIRSWTKGYLQVEGAYNMLASKHFFLPQSTIPVTPEQKMSYEKTKKELEQKADLSWELMKSPGLALTNDDIFAKATDLIFSNVSPMSFTALSGIVGGPTAAGMAEGLTEGYQAQRTALDNNVDKDRANYIGLGVGVINGLIGRYGFAGVEGLFKKAATKFTSNAMKAGVALTGSALIEGVQEALQEQPHIVAELTYRNVTVQEIVERTIESFIGGAFLGGLTTGGAVMARTTLGRIGHTIDTETTKTGIKPTETQAAVEPTVSPFPPSTAEAAAVIETIGITKPEEIVLPQPEKGMMYIYHSTTKNPVDIQTEGLKRADNALMGGDFIFASDKPEFRYGNNIIVAKVPISDVIESTGALTKKPELRLNRDIRPDEIVQTYTDISEKPRKVRTAEGAGKETAGAEITQPAEQVSEQFIEEKVEPLTPEEKVLIRETWPGKETEKLSQPPGVTREELKIVGAQKASEMRAYQMADLPVGYKKGIDVAVKESRVKIEQIRKATEFKEENRQEAIKLVQDYIPKKVQYKYIKFIQKATTPKQIQHLTERIEKHIDRIDKQNAVSDIKNFIAKTKSEFNRGITKFGYLRENVRKAFTDFLDKYDLSKLSEDKQAELEARADFIERAGADEEAVRRLSGEIANVYENAFDESEVEKVLKMGNSRIEELKRLNKTPIKDLDADDIRMIQSELERLVAIDKAKGNSINRRRAEKLSGQVNDAGNEIVESKGVMQKIRDVVPLFSYLTKTGAARIDSLVKQASGKVGSMFQVLWKDLHEVGMDKKNAKHREFIEYTKEREKAIGFTTKDAEKLYDIVDSDIVMGGKKFRTSLDNLVALYAHYQAEGNLRQLLKSKGLNIVEYEKIAGILNYKKTIRTGKVTLAEINEALSKVPDIYKKWVDEVLFPVNWDKQAKAVNEVFRETENYEPANEKKHWHLDREIIHPMEGGKVDIAKAPEASGRYQKKTGGNSRINIVPASIEFMDGLEADATLYGMRVPLENARTMLANEKFRNKMIDSGNEKVLKELEVLIRRSHKLFYNQTELQDRLGGFLGKAGQSILSLRLSGGLVQLTSPSASFYKLPAKYFTYNLSIPTGKDIQNLMNDSPLLWHRWKAKAFNFVIGDVAAAHAYMSMIHNKMPFSEKLTEHYTKGDEGAIWTLYKASENLIEDTTELKRGTPEFRKAAIKFLENEVMPTQGMYDALYRSDLTGSNDLLIRGTQMFMSTMNSFYNTLLQANDDLAKGRITKEKWAETYGGVGLSITLGVTVRRLFQLGAGALAMALLAALGLGEWDEEKLKDVAIQDAKDLPADVIYETLGIAPFGRQIGRIAERAVNSAMTGKIQYKSSGTVFEQAGENIANASMYMGRTVYLLSEGRDEDAEKSALRAADNLAAFIAMTKGLPYSGVKSDFYYPMKQQVQSPSGSGRSAGRSSSRSVNR